MNWAGLTRIFNAAKSEGRVFDSNVDMAAGGWPKLVATGTVWSQRITRVNQTPLRAASSAEIAHTPATVKAHVVAAQTAIDPAEREASAALDSD